MSKVSNIIKPMKAPSESLTDFESLTYPVLASAKIDGLRCMGNERRARSSSMELFPNVAFDQAIAKVGEFINGLDGEVVVGSPFGTDTLKRAKEGLRARGGDPDWHWHVFDDFYAPNMAFQDRHGRLYDRLIGRHANWMPSELRDRIHVLPHCSIANPEKLFDFEQACLAQGYEGVMVRKPGMPYKFGRCTFKEGWVYKVKRFEDAEAVVVDLEEGSHNLNEAQTRADGATKRATKKSGMVGAGVVGTIIGMDVRTGAMVRIATGRMTSEQRLHYWQHPEEIIKKIITYKFFPFGTARLPRHPTFKDFRDKALQG